MYSFPSRSQTLDPLLSAKYKGYGAVYWIALPTPPGISLLALSKAAAPLGVRRSYSSIAFLISTSPRSTQRPVSRPAPPRRDPHGAASTAPHVQPRRAPHPREVARSRRAARRVVTRRRQLFPLGRPPCRTARRSGFRRGAFQSGSSRTDAP